MKRIGGIALHATPMLLSEDDDGSFAPFGSWTLPSR